MSRLRSARSVPTSLPAILRERKLKQRRAILFEALENRSLLATITGNTAIGGFELLNSPSLLYQLNASSLALGNGAPVTAWNNSGAATNHFVQADPLKQPTFQNTGLGGNNLPGVVFDGETAGQGGNPVVAPNADELLLTTSTSPATVFIVNSTSKNNSSLDGIWGRENSDYGIRRTGANNWQNPGGGFNSDLFVNGVSGPNPSAPLNSDHILTAIRAPGTSIATTSIGDYFQVTTNAARSWGGQIGDVVAFDRSLLEIERQVIENALSAKYDIPLSAADFYQGDTAGAGNYDLGVFGMGFVSLENVALGKPTTQSSTRSAGGTSNRAVDGNTNNVFGGNSITHNNTEEAPWWEVDLGASHDLYSMIIFNRAEGLQSRLANVQVTTVSGVTTTFTSALLNPDPAGAPNQLTLDFRALNGGNPIVGQKVRITLQDADVAADEVLSLAEVQIFAPQARTNVALGKPTTQSSDSSGGVPSRAVDGNTNGSFGAGSVTHTASQINPWWMVDLGADTPITQVNLFNRTDCCMDRLQDVRIQILNAADVVVATSPLLNPANNMPGETGSVSNPFLLGWDFAGSNGGTPLTGRKVRVQMEDAVNAQVLSLAEVQVFTPAATTPAIPSAGQAGFGLEATSGNNAALLAGYKQTANSLVTTDLPAGVDSRWDRAWYVDKTGAMAATMAFDFSDAGIASVPATTVGYQLLYSPNNNFESAHSSFTALNLTPTVVGDLITFSVPDGSLQDGYYTLGLLDAAVTLQPDSAAANNGTADAWRIVRGGPGNANLEFYHGATLVRSTPFASLTSVLVSGSNDNDTFTVDFINGDAVPTGMVTFNGGGPTTGPGDKLIVNGGTHALVTKNHINSSDGNVVLDTNTINYTGLEPVDITGTTITSLVINLPDTDDATDDVTTFGISAGNLIVDSVNGEHEDDSISLSGITSLTINGRAGDDVITLLSSMSAFTGNITIDGGANTDDINLNSALTLTTNSLNVTGETIDVGAVTITTTTGNQTYTGLLGLSGTTLTTGAGSVILGGNVNVIGAAVSNITGNLNLGGATRTFTVADAVAGAGVDLAVTAVATNGGITKAGVGTMGLTGVNTYTGPTTINAGILQANSTSALGNGSATNTLVFGGGTLVATGAISSPATRGVTINATAVIDTNGQAVSIAGVIAGAGGLTKNNTGTLTLSGNNTYSGITTLNRGTTTITTATALGATGAGNHTVVNGADGATSTTLQLNPGAAINVAEQFNLAASGAGRVTLLQSAQNNTISGNIDVSSTGNLVQFNSGGGSLTVTGDIVGTMSGGSLLFLRGGSTSANNRLLGSVNLTGGGLSKTDAGLWVVGAAGETYSWTNTLAAVGTLRMGAANVLPPTGTLTLGQNDNNAVTFDANNFNQTTAGITFNRNTATTGVATLTTGTGVLTLNGNLTYNATTATAAGVISGNLDLGGGTRTFTVANAPVATDLNLNNLNLTNGSLIKAGPGLLSYGGGAAFALNLTTVTVSAGTLQHAGGGATYTVGGGTGKTNVASGATFISATGTLINTDLDIAAGGVARFTAATTPSVGSLSGAGSLILDATAASPFTAGSNNLSTVFSGVISEGVGFTGSFAKTGTGTMVLSGTNTYSGTTAVNAGTLQLQNGAAILDTAGAVSVALGATLQLLNSETLSSYVGAGDGVGSNDSTLALGANTLTTTGSAAIANVTTAAGAGIIAGTSITDNDDDNNITGPNVYLQATTGIGTAGDPIETAVSNIQLNNSTSGVINILNSNAGALLTVSDLRTLGFGSRNLGGATTIVNSGPLGIAADVISAGAVVLTAADTATVGVDNLNVAAGVTIESTGSTVTLNAGDGATVPATARLAAVGNVTINIDAASADAGSGGSLLFAGDVDAPLAIFNGFGDTVGDAFNTIRPDQDVGDVLTPIQVNGLAPVANPNGDSLVLDITGLGIPVLTLGPGARNGSFSFGALAAPLTYTDIENVSTSPALPYHLVLDMRFSGFENGAADTILAQLNAAGTDLILDVNGGNVFTGPDNVIQSLTIIGSTDDDALTIQETAGGLPKFLGGAPIVNNTGIGGGVSNGSHLNGNADLALETLRAFDTPWDAGDVTIHFDGGAAGNDSLTVNYTTFNNTGYFSDTSDSGNSGNVMSAPGAFPVLGAPTFLASFANLEPLNLNSTGGGLLLTDASGTAATSTLVATDIGATTQIVGDNGFATTTFGGYNALVMVGGDGAELIDIISVDGATLTSVTVFAGNTNDLFSLAGGDVSADTIRLRSLPLGTSAALSGNAGSDAFQLYDAGNTVDNIGGPVVVDGNDGNVGGNTDTLTIIDSGDLNSDLNVVISAVSPASSQDYSIEGINTASGSDVIFRNIDTLDYTSTAAADQIDGRFESTAPPHDLNIVNLSGWTGADQFLLYTSDQIGGTGLNNTPTNTPSGIANINLYGDAPGNPNGGDGNDIFGATPPVPFSGTGAMNVGLVVSDDLRMIRPSASTSIAIDGGTPTGLAAPLGDATGDVVNVNISALPNSSPVIVSTFGPGTVVATGIQPLTWTEVEDINLVDQGKLTNAQMGDLFARTTLNPDLVQITRNPTPLNPNQVRLRITATIGNYSASNKTIVYGGAMNDTLTQANLTIPAEFYGEAGDDYISGATNNDWLVGGDGNDRVNGGLGDNIIWGDNSPTDPTDPQPQDLVAGGDDQLSGLSGSDVFYGGGGNDLVSAGGGNDYAYGGEGDDTLDGHDGDDRLYGGNGNDVLSGYEGNDLLTGAAGDDSLYGHGGNDVLFGGTGADLLDAGSGNDLLVSGSVAIETSSWTSQPTTATFNAATYTRGSDNDAALLALLTTWAATSNRGTLGTVPAITHDGANDDLWGSTGDDDFCWEAADVLDIFPATTPSDYNAAAMGTDERFGPT